MVRGVGVVGEEIVGVGERSGRRSGHGKTLMGGELSTTGERGEKGEIGEMGGTVF